MKIGEDGMKLDAMCVVNKPGLLKKKSNLLVAHPCILKASVTAGNISIEIPEKNIVVSVRTQDILQVLNATNETYKGLKKKDSENSQLK